MDDKMIQKNDNPNLDSELLQKLEALTLEVRRLSEKVEALEHSHRQNNCILCPHICIQIPIHFPINIPFGNASNRR